ncbi:MAG: helix-turn-helix domain-containing protein [Chloroflexi bacterium]|nr:helix-turn-helix domain-containing protein [Chloroflexota bacterium]
MNYVMEGRSSDSSYIDKVWYGGAYGPYSALCPAQTRWDLLLLRHEGRIRISVEGPLTRVKPKVHPAGTEWRVIKFQLGTFLPKLPITHLLNGEFVLPEGSHKTFWLNGSTWQFPEADDVEAFVSRLGREDLLVSDPLVTAVLRQEPQDVSARTVRRRFLQATGLTYKGIQQIERAEHAMNLLLQGRSILDTVYDAGYADQPHMTRALQRFVGQTPAQIARSMMQFA